MPVDKKSLAPAGFTPKAPKASGSYLDKYPTRYAWRSGVEKMVRAVYERFGWDKLHANTYWDHPPGLGRDFTSVDVWGPAGRGDPLDTDLHGKVFDFLFEYEGLPDIEWIISRRSMWGYIGGWTNSPAGPADSDARHDLHLHVTYKMDGAGELPKGEPGGGDASVLYGIDIASHQKGIDLARAGREGFGFCVVKATEGPTHDGWIYANPEYKAQLSGAKKTGMIVGSYHFLVEGDPKAQVRHFLNVVGGAQALKDQLVAVDFEEYGNRAYPQYDPTNATLKGFIAELRAALGPDKPILVYSGRGYWNAGQPSGDLAGYGKNLVAWDAYYPLGFEKGAASSLYERCDHLGWGERWGGVEPKIWQFTSTAAVAGMFIDANAFRGSRADLAALVGNQALEPEPPKPPVEKSWREEVEERLAAHEERLKRLEGK